MSNRIERPQPPALPQSTGSYDRKYTDQFNSVLRLFFRRLTATVNELLSTDSGGRYLYMPNGLFYSTVDQSAAVVNTGYPIEFENVYLGSGVSIVGGTEITVAADGVYSFQVTLKTEHTTASAATVWTWINKNGTDVPYGGQVMTIKGAGSQAIFWNFSIDLTAGQYIEMYWAADDITLSLQATAPTAPHPGIPSAIVSVGFVSNL